MSKERRSSVRARMTVQYAGVFLLAGALLLTLNYALVRRNIDVAPDVLRQRIEQQLGHPIGAIPAGQVPDPANERLFQATQRELVHETLRQIVLQSVVALGVMALVSGGLGWLAAGRVLRPVAEMTDRARRISQTNLHERFDLSGPQDELKELADTFDGLLGRLDAAFASQKRFAANASHELRTPLSIIRAEVDVTLSDPHASAGELRTMGETIRDAANRSELLIEGLLALARSDAGIQEPRPIDLRQLTDEVLEQCADRIRGSGLSLRGARAAIRVPGDRALLQAMVTNLVENAVRYNESNGWLEVSIHRNDGCGVLQVRNSGPLVPADRLTSLFEPFTRMAPGRTGSDRGAGLGLSIARAVAEAHGATFQGEAPPEGGLDIRVTFPPLKGSENCDQASDQGFAAGPYS